MLFGDVFGPSFLIVTERAYRIQELLGILVDKGSGRYSRDCAIMHLFLRPLPACLWLERNGGKPGYRSIAASSNGASSGPSQPGRENLLP